MTAIAKNPGGTAADAARASGLSTATVSRMCAELLKQELIVVGGRIRGGRGQPGAALYLNKDGAFSVGCQIGFGKCHMLLRGLGREILVQNEFTIDNCSASHVAERAAACFSQIISKQSKLVHSRLIGCGFAIPSDFGRLYTRLKVDLGETALWNQRQFEQNFTEQTGYQAHSYAMGTAGAWAELAAIEPPRPADYLYLYIDQFVQSGALLDGQLWIAPHNKAGNIGRTVLNKTANAPMRLYDVMPGFTHQNKMAQCSSKSNAEQKWLAPASSGLAQSIQYLTDSLELPLVIIDGDLDGQVLDRLVSQTSAELAGLCWHTPPHVKRGLAGQQSPARGAALRLIYLAFFSDRTDAEALS